MARFSIAIGSLLIVLGISVYAILMLVQDRVPSVTALIPAMAGLPILVLGLVALIDKYRPHAMHVVALLSLLGFLMPVARLLMKVGSGGEVTLTAITSLSLMALLCGILFGGCLKSFIDARRRRAG
jgi:hypothetical protein